MGKTSKKSFHFEFANTAQKIAWAAFEQNDLLFLTGPPGTGKTFLAAAFAVSQFKSGKKRIILTRPIVEAGEKLGYLPGPQPLDAKILTPSGWTTMGQIKPGDLVIGRDGKPVRVLKIYPKGKKLVYKVTTLENASTECCADHLWLTRTRDHQKSIKTTQQIIDTLKIDGKINHFIPKNEAVEFEKQELAIPAYTLGFMLAAVNKKEVKILAGHHSKIAEVADTHVIDQNHIPDNYKYSSIEDRMDLLEGLIDFGGSVDKRGRISYKAHCSNLAKDIVELARSLGGKAIIEVENEVLIRLPEEINPYFSVIKPHPTKDIGIKSIEPVGEKEAQCILVDSDEHLYITDDYIVTHNTFDEKVAPYMMPLYDCLGQLVGYTGPEREQINMAIEVAPVAYLRGRDFRDSICIFDEAQNATFSQLKLFVTRLGMGSKMIINGDPSQSDIPNSGLVEMIRRLKTIQGVGMVEFKANSIVRHPLLMKILDKLE